LLSGSNFLKWAMIFAWSKLCSKQMCTIWSSYTKSVVTHLWLAYIQNLDVSARVVFHFVDERCLLRRHVHNLLVTVQFFLLQLPGFFPVLALVAAAAGGAATTAAEPALEVAAATGAPRLVGSALAIVVVEGSALVGVLSVFSDLLVLSAILVVFVEVVEASTATAAPSPTAERSAFVVSVATASVAAAPLASGSVGTTLAVAIVLVEFALAVGLSLGDSTGVRC
jgi:hypothetical protein